MKKIAVLGTGLVGGPMVVDLAGHDGFEVLAIDRDEKALKRLEGLKNITIRKADLSREAEVASVLKDVDMVINAVPGFMGFKVLKWIISAQKDVVDIAFFPEDPFELDEFARQNGVTAVVDCGVAPGMSNLLTGYAASKLDEAHTAVTYVGGLPQLRSWPYEYKAVFSPIDVIEEYTRPARYIENGVQVIRPALSDVELIDFPVVGTLEVFNTDGLRTLAKTMNIPNMKEKTMRYPGHIEKMAVLRETGFFSEEPIKIGGSPIRPIDLTAKLLFPMWEMKEGEGDITVMRVWVEGFENGKTKRYTYDLLDRFDEDSKTHSMARTTGYTATVAARLLRDGLYTKKGISPPEYLGKSETCVTYMLKGLAERGVHYVLTES